LRICPIWYVFFSFKLHPPLPTGKFERHRISRGKGGGMRAVSPGGHAPAPLGARTALGSGPPGRGRAPEVRLFGIMGGGQYTLARRGLRLRAGGGSMCCTNSQRGADIYFEECLWSKMCSVHVLPPHAATGTDASHRASSSPWSTQTGGCKRPRQAWGFYHLTNGSLTTPDLWDLEPLSLCEPWAPRSSGRYSALCP
jgi:hypothetical protein